MKTRDQNKRYRIFVIFALVTGIMTLSIAFTTVSKMIKIDGTSNKKGTTWSITFANLSKPILTGKATVDYDAKLINNSTTLNFAVSLQNSEDSVIYYFDIKNNGTYDAIVNTVTLTGLSSALANNIKYTLTYADGSSIEFGDTLDSGETRNLKLMITYISSTNTSTTDIFLNLGATVEYIQY